MDIAQIFADVGQAPWGELRTCGGGSAEHVPGMLRALASADEDEADTAFLGLYETLLDDGAVCEATAAAIPFLARLAAAGCESRGLLEFLGAATGDPREEHAPSAETAACRRALAAQLPLILPLTGETADPRVRQTAAWAAARTGAAAEATPVLRRRWAEEQDPLVRAELLAGLVRLDPRCAAEFALPSLGSEHHGSVRIVAVLMCLDAGLPWTPSLHETALSLLPAEPLVLAPHDQERTDPVRYVLDALLARGADEDRDSAYTLLDAALRSPDPRAQAEALKAADHACTVSRAAPGRLVPALAALLRDAAPADEPDVVREALDLLARLGRQAAPAVPELTALAAADDDDLADRALEALVRVAPEASAPLLARSPLGLRPGALAAACGLPEDRPAPPIPCTPELLDAVRARLTVPDLEAFDGHMLSRRLTAWGPAAAAALPELTAALPRFPNDVPGALAAVCPTHGSTDRDRVAGLLRAAATHGPQEGRLAAAAALHELTEETGPLLDALPDALDGYGLQVANAAAQAAGLGRGAARLRPALRSALAPRDEIGRDERQLAAEAETALALYRLGGTADEAVAVLSGVLDDVARARPGCRWPVLHAAEAAAGLGPEGRPLIPALERLLGDPETAPAAVGALLALGHRFTDPDRVADRLLDAAECAPGPESALDALRELLAHHPELRTSGGVLPRLTELAERDRRVAASDLVWEAVVRDELFRACARDLLARERRAPVA
ncbi:HEAT repeat domain-containing protein [Streptomyces sp. HNM0663]|uniref:HEAT repeat domain-containing protein n=1 Tax=Streptomyces chengmaiensis TaxID=3040919 RepID=A0ABT6HKF9_9ACTN|nr:HEAT repeat domain-containing protein [Streptomyces chengmaiensis]MDH2389233.1 HEAT repeat domain-containing protein [Streptomyces chengmaiensis]